MLPALIKKSIRQFIYCHHHSPGLQPHLSTRWTGQTRLTNSQGAIHESWMGRCSPRAPGFSREQYAWFYPIFKTFFCFWMKHVVCYSINIRVTLLLRDNGLFHELLTWCFVEVEVEGRGTNSNRPNQIQSSKYCIYKTWQDCSLT